MAVLLLVPGYGAASARPAPGDLTGGLKNGGLPDVVSVDLDTDGVRDYWTADRMRSAVPADLDPDGDLIPGTQAASPRTAPRASTITSPRSAGKLFFTTRQGNAVCSAAAVNTAQKNVIITAAHCAHTGPRNPCGLLQNCPEYFTNFLFVPRFNNGSSPDGRWVGSRAITHREWIVNEDLDYDQALIEVAPLNGRKLVDVVGGNGLAWNFPARQADIAVFGWPAQAPYDGQTVKRCTGTTTPLDGTSDAFIKCPLNGGASGGPWFIGRVNSNVGFIFAVTSRRTTSGTPYLIANPLDSSILKLLSNARLNSRSSTSGTTVLSNPARLPSYSTRAASVPSVFAARSSVGRGQLAVLRARGRAGTNLLLDVRFSPTGRWTNVTFARTSSSGTVDFKVRVASVGDRWYRVRSATASSRPARVRVFPCPLPFDRTPSVVDATACTSPVS